MKTVLLGISMMVLFMTSGCLYAVRYDGPYKGKVVDADTREPIDGAVVLGTWSVYHFDLAGGHHTYHDARETVTDKNGEFTIPGEGLRVMSSLEPMSVLIFKAGYEYMGSVQWDSLKISDYFQKRITWEGNKAIFPLKKLTMEERKKRLFGKENIPDKNQIMFIRELNKERIEIGLIPYQEVK